MSHVHVARIMHDFLHRGVEREWPDLLQFDEKEEFYTVQSKPATVNMCAYALGHLQLDPNWTDVNQLDRTDLLTDRKLYKQLERVVNRMPTLEFQFIPLVMLTKDKLESSFLLRVRVSSCSADCVYLELSNRKYNQFAQFLASTKLPACTIFFPRDGVLRYSQNDKRTPMLQIDCQRVEHRSAQWRTVTIAGSVAASLLAFTPLGVTVGVPLLLVSGAASTAFSISDLVDGCKYEAGSVIAERSAALAFSITAFATAGLTAVCKIEKLRRLIPASKLVQLERAEQLLSGGVRKVGTGSVFTTVLGTTFGWRKLPVLEQMQLGAMLCFAYRKSFTTSNMEYLFHMLQQSGVVKFFQVTCSNVSLDLLRTKLSGPCFDYYLQLVIDYLESVVSFSVNNNFTTLFLGPYSIEFDTMFDINWAQMKMLLLFLQDINTTVDKVCRNRFTQDTLNDVLQLLQLVGRVRDFSCTIADYITLGKGHRFTFETVRTFITETKHIDRLELLKQLASFGPEDTQRLNELRASGRIEGGDRALFNWLACHRPVEYRTALNALLALANEVQRTKPMEGDSIKFNLSSFIVNSLLTLNADQLLAVPPSLRGILLRDERFLRLCNDADEHLLARANHVWIRTCTRGIDTIRQLDTIWMLEQLFAGVANLPSAPLQLAEALDYALDTEESTVPQVYYRILVLWNQLTASPLNLDTMKVNFQRLLEDAKALNMARYHTFGCDQNNSGNYTTIELSDDELIENVRTMLPLPSTADGWNASAIDYSIPVGTAERAACWLELMPALRNASSRERSYRALSALLTSGSAVVLEQCDRTTQHYVTVPWKKVLKFTDDKEIIVEVLPPDEEQQNGMWRASFCLCDSDLVASSGREA